MNKRKYLVLASILLFIGLVSATFGIVLDYTKILGTINSKQIVGDIYMHYTSGNEININMLPKSTRPDEYFEFTVSGKNTSDKDIIYDVVLQHGSDHQTKTERIEDRFLSFTLIEIKDNVETTVVDSKSYSELLNTRIYTDTIDGGTNNVTHTYRLYAWINESVLIGNVSDADYDIDTWNNQVYATLKVSVTGDFSDKKLFYESDKVIERAKARENDGSNCKTYVEEDGITYLSGTSECIDFNYLWYSGHMWRITAIYPDGSMKLVTNKTITDIQFDSSGSVNYYIDENNNSTIYQYLNNDFLNTLYNYEEFIDTTKYWNATMPASTDISTKLEETEATMIPTTISPIGLLNSYEYYKSYQNVGNSNYSLGYLKTAGYGWWLLNPRSSLDSMWIVSSDGYGSHNGPTKNTNGSRPSVYLKSGIIMTGNGTIENPYTLKDDKKEDKRSLLYKIKHKNDTNCKTYIEEDGITYLSGTSDCIDFNYVWWSGKMWRITAIYPDGAMKMVTDNNITSIAFNDTAIYYDKTNGTGSWMFQWLNEDFLDTLYNQGANVIDTTKYWNATMPASTDISTKLEEIEATMIPTTISPVGLLNSYEYYKSYQKNSSNIGYLNTSYYWWLLNPRSSLGMWIVKYDGSGNNQNMNVSYGVRPSIYLKSGISLSGNGTKNDPYRLSSDYNDANIDDKIYTRHSGEYIKFDTDGSSGNYDNAPLFRIVGVEGEGNTRITKIVAMDYAASSATKQFASTVNYGASGNTQSSDYWDYYLNNDWYDSLSFKDKLESGTYYIGTTGANYKLAVCSTTGSYTTSECLSDSSKRVTTTFTGNVGLLRYGEMFATQQGSGYSNSITMWLITKVGSPSLYVRYVNFYGDSNYDTLVNTYYGSRPSYYLKSSVKILSGSGTELDPYIVS